MCNELLSDERVKLARYSPDGRLLDYLDRSDYGIDHMESARDFLQSIQDFVHHKADELAKARTKMGFHDGLNQVQLAMWKYRGSQCQSKVNPLSAHSKANQAQ